MFGAGVCHAVLMAEGQLSERERQDRKMIVATVFGKIISIFIIMIVGVICCKMGIIDDYTKQRLSRLSTLVVNPILIFTSFQMEYDSELLKNGPSFCVGRHQLSDFHYDWSFPFA